MNLEKWLDWLSNLEEKMPFDTMRVFLIVGTYVLGKSESFPLVLHFV
ncbi:hypothetical protein [Desulfosporosinus sp. SB140]